MDKEMFATEVMSYTHNRKNHVVVSKKYLKPGEHILIMDDFLANGCAVSGLLDLVKQAGGIVEGVGICIEKVSRAAATRSVKRDMMSALWQLLKNGCRNGRHYVSLRRPE